MTYCCCLKVIQPNSALWDINIYDFKIDFDLCDIDFQGHSMWNLRSWTPIYDSQLAFNSDIWSNSCTINVWNLSGPDFDLSTSPKIKSDGAVGTPHTISY